MLIAWLVISTHVLDTNHSSNLNKEANSNIMEFEFKFEILISSIDNYRTEIIYNAYVGSMNI